MLSPWLFLPLALVSQQAVPNLSVLVSVDRPRPIDFGAFPQQETQLPVRLRIQRQGADATGVECIEQLGNREMLCPAVDWYVGPGRYVVTVATPPDAEVGPWEISLDLPDRPFSLKIDAQISLRIYSLGLSVSEIRVIFPSNNDVVLSSRELAERPWFRVGALNSTRPNRFQITNRKSSAILVRRQDGHVLGTFTQVNGDVEANFRIGRHCGTGAETRTLTAGETAPAGEMWVQRRSHRLI